MLKKTLTLAGTLGLIAALTAIPAEAGNRGNGAQKVKGHVIKVEQQTRTGKGGEVTQLTIRTRNGDQMHLNLGKGEGCQGCIQVGDQIRARVQGKQGPSAGGQVQSISVRRNGEMFNLQNNGSGSMIRQQSRSGAGSGSGQRNGDQLHTRLKDGSNCNDSGLRSGQGGANTGRGSRGGGGGRG